MATYCASYSLFLTARDTFFDACQYNENISETSYRGRRDDEGLKSMDTSLNLEKKRKIFSQSSDIYNIKYTLRII